MPTVLVLALLTVIGAGLGTVFPVSTVCMQNAVTRTQMGVATGAANFFRALFSALVVAVLGAIVLGGLGGVTGMSMEMLARAASAHELSFAFRFVFLACALVLAFGMAFLIALEERPLKGPTTPSPAATAPTAPATPIPADGHIGGNSFSQIDSETGIEFHAYGSHLFHTSNETVWNFITQFSAFTNYRHRVFSKHKEQTYTIPINLMTINRFFGLDLNPAQARAFIAQQAAAANIVAPRNFEEKRSR